VARLVTVVAVPLGWGGRGGHVVLVEAPPLSSVSSRLAEVHLHRDVIVSPRGVGRIVPWMTSDIDLAPPKHLYVFCQMVSPVVGHGGGPCMCYDMGG
jgi:hypothetical protein